MTLFKNMDDKLTQLVQEQYQIISEEGDPSQHLDEIYNLRMRRIFEICLSLKQNGVSVERIIAGLNKTINFLSKQNN